MKSTSKIFGLMMVVMVMGSLLAACKSAPVRTMESIPSSRVPTANETEIIISNHSVAMFRASDLLNIYVDGMIVAQVTRDMSERIIVSNGTHSIQVRDPMKTSVAAPTTVEANGERIILETVSIFGIVSLNNPAASNTTE